MSCPTSHKQYLNSYEALNMKPFPNNLLETNPVQACVPLRPGVPGQRVPPVDGVAQGERDRQQRGGRR